MWLLPTVFVMLLAPIARAARAGDGPRIRPAPLLLRGTVLVLIMIVWAAIIADQLPCFLGVPNCD